MMLEIPESNTLAKQANTFLKGKTIQNVVAGASVHRFAFYFGDPAMYPKLLNGKALTGARAVGGQAELFAEDARILFGDGANVRYLAPGETPPKKHQLLLEFTDGSSVVCTVSMYAGLWAYPDGENDNPYYLVALKKPNPLTDAFDKVWFEKLLAEAKPSLSTKAFLATEQRIPGLGNGVLQDILFQAGVHPKSKLSALGSGDLDRLYLSVKETLAEMARLGGRDTEKDLFGNPGGYHSILSKLTLAYPCPVCGGAITRQAYLGGNVYFCSSCQPLKN